MCHGTLDAQASWERQVILMIDMYIETLINLDIQMATDAEFDIGLHRRVVDHLKWSAKKRN